MQLSNKLTVRHSELDLNNSSVKEGLNIHV